MSTLNMAMQVLVAAQENELAAKVIDGLDRLDEKPESAKRWIWELIQNAKDASLGPNRPPVKIEIELTHSQVEFRHSGNPFTLKDLVSLICQTSMKERSSDENEVPENTGKFGTGFITTHLLSRVIVIKGIYQSEEGGINKYQKFELVLDRATQDKQEMIRRNKRAFEMFASLDDKDSYPFIQNYQPGINCDTTFCYKLDSNTLNIAKKGIQDFKNSVFQMLLFNPHIEFVKLIDKVSFRDDFYKVSNIFDLWGKVKLYEIYNSYETKYFLQAKNNFTQVCIEAQKTQCSYKIMPKPQDSPILFADFPLVGSEHYYWLPCYLNSHIFWPNEERSSVQIIQKQRYTNNQKTFQESIDLMFQLFQCAQMKNYDGLHNFAIIRTPSVTNSDWFKSNIMMPYMNLIATQLIIKTSSGIKISLRDVILPVYDSYEYIKLPLNEYEKNRVLKERFTQLWTLLVQIYTDNLICNDFEYAQTWEKILQMEWISILPQSNKKSFMDIQSFINSYNDRNSIQGRISSSISDWLEKDYRYLIDNISQEHISRILSQYKIFLNQKFSFRKLEQLYEDMKIEESYKELCLTYGYDLKEILLENICQNEISWFVKKFGRQMEFKDVEKQIYEAINHDCNYNSTKGRYDSPAPSLKLYNVYQNSSQQKKLILDLTSFLPLQTNNDKQEIKLYKKQRQEFYDFVAFYEKLPLKRFVESYESRIYVTCEKKLLEIICEYLHSISTFIQLEQRLNLNQQKEKVFSWLNQFYTYYISLPNQNLMTKKIILNEKNQFVQFTNPRKLQIDNIPQWVNDQLIFSQTNKNILLKNESLIRELYCHYALYDQNKKEDLESSLIHPEVYKSLSRDVNISIQAEKVTMKHLFNTIDKVVCKNGTSLSFIRSNAKELWKIVKICEEFRENEEVISEIMPQFLLLRKDIIFELVSDPETKSMLTHLLTDQFGKKLIHLYKGLDEECRESLSYFAEELKHQKMTKKDIAEFMIEFRKRISEKESETQNQSIEVEKIEIQIDPFIQNFNFDNFVQAYCISSKEQLTTCIQSLPKDHQELIISSIPSSYDAFAEVMRMLKRSVERVKTILSQQSPTYDISNWHIVTSPCNPNNNIVHGITKYGQPIKIVIRPTDCYKLVFHNDDEVSTLKESGAELWGDNGSKTRQIMLGEIVYWNTIRELSIKM